MINDAPVHTWKLMANRVASQIFLQSIQIPTFHAVLTFVQDTKMWQLSVNSDVMQKLLKSSKIENAIS